MRARRLGVCIERAIGAMDLGKLDDARAAVSEAKALSPDAPEIAQLESLLAFHSSPKEIPQTLEQPILHSDAGWPSSEWLRSDQAPSGSGSGWLKVLAGACALIVMLSALGFGLVRLYDRSAEQFFSVADSTGAEMSVSPGKEPSPCREQGTSSPAPEGSPK